MVGVVAEREMMRPIERYIVCKRERETKSLCERVTEKEKKRKILESINIASNYATEQSVIAYTHKQEHETANKVQSSSTAP